MSVSTEEAVEREEIEERGDKHTLAESYLALTVADFSVSHVVAGGEAVFGHGHVCVEGEREQAGGRLDLRGDLCATVAADQRSHCKQRER